MEPMPPFPLRSFLVHTMEPLSCHSLLISINQFPIVHVAGYDIRISLHLVAIFLRYHRCVGGILFCTSPAAPLYSLPAFTSVRFAFSWLAYHSSKGYCLFGVIYLMVTFSHSYSVCASSDSEGGFNGNGHRFGKWHALLFHVITVRVTMLHSGGSSDR